MNQLTTVAFLLCAVMPFCKSATAQQAYFEEYNFPSPALEISLVNGMATDANNCAWLTTQSGVYRYDGAKFKHYSTLNTTALKFERMTGMYTVLSDGKEDWCFIDAKKNLYWIDSSSRLKHLVPATNTKIIFGKYYLRVWKKGVPVAVGIPEGTIKDVYYCKDQDQFYILSMDGALATISTQQLVNGEKPVVPNTSFQKQERYDQYFQTETSFYYVSSKGFVKKTSPSAIPETVLLEGDILYTGNRIGYDNMIIFSKIKNSSLLLWYKGDIYEMTELPGTNRISTRLLAKGLAKDIPSYLYYSPVHQLLIGCFLVKGLVLYKPRQFSLLNVKDSSFKLAENYYYVAIPKDNGYITVNNSKIMWLGLNGQSRVLSKAPVSGYYLHLDRKGNIWYYKKPAGKETQGIGYLKYDSYEQVNILNTVVETTLTGMHQQNDSTYYILTDYSLRKLIYKNNKAVAQVLVKREDAEEYNLLYLKDASTLWIGYDQGLFEYNMVTNSKKTISFLAGANVRAITRLATDHYLVGTYDKWIFQYKDGKWKQLFSSDKSVAPSAHAFIVDSLSNSVWISSNKGISRLPLQQILQMKPADKGEVYAEQFTGFSKDISVEFNGSSNVSGARLSNTNAAFANANGLVTFNPGLSLSPPLPRNVLVEIINQPDSVTGKNKKKQLEFSVAVPYFGNPGNLEVLYRMYNTNDDWHRLLPNAVISYNNLKPGNYQFEFRLRHYSNDKGEEVLLVSNSFYIPAKWYQKSWFKILASIVGIALIIFFHNFRIWVLRKRKKELEQLVKSKTSELLETNENLISVINDLKLSETSLKESNFLKDEYYAVLTHDLRSPIKFLSFNISQLLELLPEISNEALKKGLVAAHECSTDVYKLIEEFVYWIEDNEKQLKPKPMPALIEAILYDIKKLYSISLESNKNTLHIDVPPGLIINTDPKILFIVLRNAVDNANKYSSNASIHASVVKNSQGLEIIIKDNGRGMSEELAKELTGLQYIKEQVSYKKRKSLGFYIMAMLTKKLKGSYTIKSIKNEGTVVSFILPDLAEEE